MMIKEQKNKKKEKNKKQKIESYRNEGSYQLK